MLTVYSVTTDGKSVSFRPGVKCITWREANTVRQQIAKNGKDGETSLTYDSNGNFIVEGWQKGYK